MPRRRLSSNTSMEKEVYSVFSKLLLVTLGPLKTERWEAEWRLRPGSYVYVFIRLNVLSNFYKFVNRQNMSIFLFPLLFFCLFMYLFIVLGMELGALWTLGKHSYPYPDEVMS